MQNSVPELTNFSRPEKHNRNSNFWGGLVGQWDFCLFNAQLLTGIMANVSTAV